MKKNVVKYITQLDYIKVLLEEDRIGEALNYVNILSKGLETECKIISDDLNQIDEIAISNVDIKIKPGNWMNVNNAWIKLLERNEQNKIMVFEVSNNVDKIVTNYKIK